MNKILGYVLAGIGLAGLVITPEQINNYIPLAKNIPSNYLLIGSLILIAAGIAVVVIAGKGESGGVKAGEEVPIYHGKKIVGYRKH